jgi:hypothetical protein
VGRVGRTLRAPELVAHVLERLAQGRVRHSKGPGEVIQALVSPTPRAREKHRTHLPARLGRCGGRRRRSRAGAGRSALGLASDRVGAEGEGHGAASTPAAFVLNVQSSFHRVVGPVLVFQNPQRVFGEWAANLGSAQETGEARFATRALQIATILHEPMQAVGRWA